MKKITAFLCVLAMLLLTCCSEEDSADSKEKLAKYEEWAAKLSVITLDSEYDILGAEAAYNALSDKQKQTVSNDVVVAARQTFTNMQELKELLPELCIKLENVFAPNNGASLSEFKEDYDKANEYINGLTDEQKKEVGNVDRFLEAAKKYESESEEVNKLAQLYVEAFLEYKKGEEITVTDVACIVNSLKGEMRYYYALKYTTGSQEKTVYTHVGMDNTHFKGAIVGHGASFFNEEPIKNYNAFEKGNYPVDSAAVIAAAGK